MTKVEKLEKKLEIAKKEESEARSRLKFPCACGIYHAIKDCVVIQTHWYTRPHGCCGGDYWNEGELQIVCPANNKLRNRVMFPSYSKVEWENRNKYAYSAEQQFSRIYKKLFKLVRDEYTKSDRSIFDELETKDYNNYYFDNNHKKFGLNVPGIKNTNKK